MMTEPQSPVPRLSLRRRLLRRGLAEPYQEVVYQFLAAYRFFAFSLGVGFFFILREGPGDMGLETTLVILVGVVNVTRVVVPPFAIIRNSVVETTALAGESGLILALVWITGGLDSPLLLHGLAPVLSASLLGSLLGATGLGTFNGLAIILAHGISQIMPRLGLPGLFSSNYLSFAVLYVATLFALAVLPFLTNLNLQRRQRDRAAEAERQQLRRELHDEVAQTLAFLSLKAQRAQDALSSGRGVVTIRDIQDMAHGIGRSYVALRDFLDGSPNFSYVPLTAALRRAAGQWSRDTALPLEVCVSGKERELRPEVARHLLGICREGLNNSARHGRPTRVWLDLAWGPGELSVRLRDDGSGFDTSHPWGLGLTGMHERAALIGASLHIESSPGQGTQVTVTWPYPQGEAS